jgi:hypothetical protein
VTDEIAKTTAGPQAGGTLNLDILMKPLRVDVQGGTVSSAPPR